MHRLALVRAEVAELVDALGSGSSVCMDMGVRVSPSAPHIFNLLFLQRVFYLKASSFDQFHLVTQNPYTNRQMEMITCTLRPSLAAI